MSNLEHPHFKDLERLERLARRMDSAYRLPGTRIRFGWDSILGLVPGVGDTLALLPAAYIFREAHRMGVPKSVLAQMGVNSGIDWVIGSVPLIGDIFDVGWKSKLRNVALLRLHLEAEAARAPGNDAIEGRLSSHHPDLRG